MNPTPLQPRAAPLACSQRQSLDESCVPRAGACEATEARFRVIAFRLRVGGQMGGSAIISGGVPMALMPRRRSAARPGAKTALRSWFERPCAGGPSVNKRLRVHIHRQAQSYQLGGLP